MNKEFTVETSMLIRKPAQAVFQALVDPAITTQFWFTKSTGKLEQGASVTWTWEMYGASAAVNVVEIIPNEKIVIRWGDPFTTVEFLFKAIAPGKTFVVIKNYGFREAGEALLAVAVDTAGGFTTLLDGMKAWLEHGLKLNLVGDKFLRQDSTK